MNGCFFINRFAIFDQQLFGLNTSDVVIEKVPLTIKPAARTYDLMRDPLTEDSDLVRSQTT